MRLSKVGPARVNRNETQSERHGNVTLRVPQNRYNVYPWTGTFAANDRLFFSDRLSSMCPLSCRLNAWVTQQLQSASSQR